MKSEFGFNHPDATAFWYGAAMALGQIAAEQGQDEWLRFLSLFACIWKERLAEPWMAHA